MSTKPTYGKALVLTFGFLLFSLLGNGQVIFDGDNCEPYGAAQIVDGDDVSSDPSDLLNFWASAQRDGGIDYLYLTFSRVSSGAAGFTFYINTDCDINTGDSSNQGADILLLFGIKKTGGVFSVTNTDIYNYSGGSYFDSLLDFNAKIGESNCLDPTSEGEFIELRIELNSFFDPCQSVCNSFSIENVSSSASPSINSTTIDSFSASIPIGINSSPVAQFAHPINHCVGEDITFYGSPSTYYDSNSYTILTAPDSNDNIVSYEWDFDYDGITFNTQQTGSTPSYTYISSGNYTIALRVTDSFGCTNIDQQTIIIFDNLTPLFTYNPLNTCYSVDFNSSTTVDPTGGNNLIFEWDFSYDNVTFNLEDTGASLNYIFPSCGSYQVALRVTDPDGAGLCQPAILIQTVSVTETEVPIWTTAINSLNVTLECDDTLGLTNTMAFVPVSSDNCDASPTIAKSTGAFVADVGCTSNGTYTNTWTSTDSCGNISMVFTQVITIQDTTAPTWTTAASNLDIILDCDDSNGLTNAMALAPVSNDGCDTSPIITKTTGAFDADVSCTTNGTYTNTWTSTDSCGNISAVFTQVISIQDTTAPTWTTAINSLNIALECDDATGLSNAMALAPISYDICDTSPTITKTTGAFVADVSCASNGTYTNTWTSTDTCGNISAVFTQIISIQDTTAPTWTTAINSLNITLECDDITGLTNAMALVPFSNDNCDGAPTVTKTTGAFVADVSCASNGTYTNTWTSTDGCGNISAVFTQVISIQDTTAPTWTTAINSLNITLECDDTIGLSNAMALAPVSNDICDASPTITKTTGAFVADVSCASNGTYTNTWTSTDACGNISAVFTQVISIQDTTAPTWDTASNNLNVTLECDDSTGLSNAMALVPVSNDNCDGTPVLSKTTGAFVADVSCASNGTYTNTWTSSDACGNISAIFTQVISIQDTTAPTWTTAINSLNITLECDDTTELTNAMALVPVSNDNCDGAPTVTKTTGAFVADVSCASNGTYTNTWTSTDACGNISAVFTQVISIQDTTAPTWTTAINSFNITLECDDTTGLSNAMALVPISNDNCDGTPVLSKTTGTFVADVSCASNGTYTNTWTSTDICGNISAVFTQVISIQDTTAPTWATATNNLNFTLECDDSTGLNNAMTLSPVSNDNCDGSPVLSKTTGAFVADVSCASNGTYTNTWISTDACGNISTVFTQIISIQDTTAPTWTTATNNLNVTLECDDTIGLTNAMALAPVSNDNCDGAPTITKTTGAFVADVSCASNGSYTNTWTSTDACGNISTVFTQVISIQDTTAPNWITASNSLNFTLECDDSNGLNNAMALAPVSNDGCDGTPVISKTTGAFIVDVSCASNGTYTNTWTSRDACGNISAVFTQIISIQDTSAPSWTTASNNLNVTLECDDSTGLNEAMALSPVSNDNCDGSPVLSKTTGAFVADVSCASNGTYTNTWTSTDTCGNISAVFTQIISIQDTTAPTGIAPLDVLDLSCLDDIPDADINAVTNIADNCSNQVEISVADTNNGGSGCYGDPYIITRTYTLRDACNNTTDLIQLITAESIIAPNAGIDTATTLCYTDEYIDLFSLIEGTPDIGGTWFPELESGTNIFDPKVDFAGDYIYTVVGDCICADAFSTLSVSINEAPIITNIEVNDCAEENSIIIYAEGANSGSLYDSTNFEYSIDGVTFQDDNVFENVSPGAHTIVVRDKNGCGYDRAPSDIIIIGIDAPDYFTPNGDSYHDTWHIRNIQDFSSAKIYIFDRFGKLIIELGPNSQGWDGTFQGKRLPATDYWFQAELPCSQGDIITKKGHFSLLR